MWAQGRALQVPALAEPPQRCPLPSPWPQTSYLLLFTVAFNCNSKALGYSNFYFPDRCAPASACLAAGRRSALNASALPKRSLAADPPLPTPAHACSLLLHAPRRPDGPLHLHGPAVRGRQRPVRADRDGRHRAHVQELPLPVRCASSCPGAAGGCGSRAVRQQAAGGRLCAPLRPAALHPSPHPRPPCPLAAGTQFILRRCVKFVLPLVPVALKTVPRWEVSAAWASAGAPGPCADGSPARAVPFPRPSNHTRPPLCRDGSTSCSSPGTSTSRFVSGGSADFGISQAATAALRHGLGQRSAPLPFTSLPAPPPPQAACRTTAPTSTSPRRGCGPPAGGPRAWPCWASTTRRWVLGEVPCRGVPLKRARGAVGLACSGAFVWWVLRCLRISASPHPRPASLPSPPPLPSCLQYWHQLTLAFLIGVGPVCLASGYLCWWRLHRIWAVAMTFEHWTPQLPKREVHRCAGCAECQVGKGCGAW